MEQSARHGGIYKLQTMRCSGALVECDDAAEELALPLPLEGGTTTDFEDLILEEKLRVSLILSRLWGIEKQLLILGGIFD